MVKRRRSNAGRLLYAVIGPDNEVLAVEDNEARAVDAGYSMTDNVFIDEIMDLPDFREENPLGARGPEIAHRRMNNLVISMRDVEKLSIAEAHERLVGYFPFERFEKKRQTMKSVAAWQTPSEMVSHLLGKNDKTAKTDLNPLQQQRLMELFPTKDGISVEGLTLLPNVSYSKIAGGGDIQGRAINTCIGASKECIASCLVYSGRNDADPYNLQVKFAKLNALMQDPVAFGRILYEACKIKETTHKTKRKSANMVRLNVFSDIPWETVFPELFEALTALQFYDYTKVPYRRTPPNYDLTFSYSGRNLDDVVAEVNRGRRVAVVFLTAKHRLPASFLGYPVVDGDMSDARPLDPAPSIVGLAYKAPLKAAQKVLAAAKESVFVVPVEEIDGVLVAAVVPRDQPGVEKHVDQDATPDGAVVAGEGSTAFVEGLIPANTLVRRANPSVNKLKSKLLR